MKTEFQFPVSIGYAALPETISINFGANGVVPLDRGNGVIPEEVRDFRVSVALVPTSERKNLDAHLAITVPGRPHEYEVFANQLAVDVSQYLIFYYPEFTIQGSLVTAVMIPETAEEIAEVGDRPYIMKFALEQVGEPPTIDPRHLRTFARSFPVRRLLRQFNTARGAPNPIDAFLGMFKVLESAAHVARVPAKKALKMSAEIREALRSSFESRMSDSDPFAAPDDAAVDRLIDDLVDTRHRCAHLREEDSFGLVALDQDVYAVVRPLCGIIESAAQIIIEARMSTSPGGPSATDDA